MPNPKLNDPDITTEEKLKIAETNHWVGRNVDLIIVLRKIPGDGLKVNIDKGFGSKSEDEKRDRGQVKKIVKLAFQRENINPHQYEVWVLWTIGAQRFGNEWDVNCGMSRGSSGGSAGLGGLEGYLVVLVFFK